MKKIIQAILLTTITILSIILTATTTHAANLQPYMIHDQRHILTPAQKQQIIQQNGKWSHQRRRQQIWVYTFKQMPSTIKDGLSDDDSTGEISDDVSTSILTKAVKSYTPADGDYDRETMVDQRLSFLTNQVSILVVYPRGGGQRVLFTKSEDLRSAVSDFQNWRMNLGLSKQVDSNTALMKYVHVYTPFINKHVANAAMIKQGISWDNIWEIIFGILIVWGFIGIVRFVRHTPGGGGGDSDSSFDDGYVMGRWMR